MDSRERTPTRSPRPSPTPSTARAVVRGTPSRRRPRNGGPRPADQSSRRRRPTHTGGHRPGSAVERPRPCTGRPGQPPGVLTGATRRSPSLASSLTELPREAAMGTAGDHTLLAVIGLIALALLFDY